MIDWICVFFDKLFLGVWVLIQKFVYFKSGETFIFFLWWFLSFHFWCWFFLEHLLVWRVIFCFFLPLFLFCFSFCSVYWRFVQFCLPVLWNIFLWRLYFLFPGAILHSQNIPFYNLLFLFNGYNISVLWELFLTLFWGFILSPVLCSPFLVDWETDDCL